MPKYNASRFLGASLDAEAYMKKPRLVMCPLKSDFLFAQTYESTSDPSSVNLDCFYTQPPHPTEFESERKLSDHQLTSTSPLLGEVRVSMDVMESRKSFRSDPSAIP